MTAISGAVYWNGMKGVRTLLHDQVRTIIVLTVIGLVLAVNGIWKLDWPVLFNDAGILPTSSISPRTPPRSTGLLNNGQPADGGMDKPLPADSPPRSGEGDAGPQPDYVLPPVTAGLAPVVNRIETSRPVVFLTIDDGMTASPEASRLLNRYRIKAPMFLNDVYVKDKPDYFKRLIAQGMTVGSHTVDHTDLTTLDYAGQRDEICQNADNMENWLGQRPSLFRPPYGDYDWNTRRAAADCGMRALVMWSAKANGGSMQYQDGHGGLVAGDIVLMHFRPEFAQDFEAFIDAAKAAGLQPVNLSEWLRPHKPLTDASI